MWKFLFVLTTIMCVGCNSSNNNYENIRTVEFSDDLSDPMGGLMIRGTVNGNAGFSASVDPQEFTVNSLGEKKGFPKVKDECKEKVCGY
ncbi:hypothetical protein [Sediminibacillus halophilus]|uniref:Uncharacterized protein n=1 Tax=Sediminibacillus halophilus TaxID=482461 RepID=A0A1G9V5M7_9BACI|nr:hypothetical protein [Sediminibacillus halophilus]SDM67449.1 hypothetical protein SAMN05216244_3141 [Sediminibacillus halophilus]